MPTPHLVIAAQSKTGEKKFRGDRIASLEADVEHIAAAAKLVADPVVLHGLTRIINDLRQRAEALRIGKRVWTP